MADPRARPERPFRPRVINPVKIRRVTVFSGDSGIREALPILTEFMPWVQTEILGDPRALVRRASGEAAAFLFDDTGLKLCDTDRLRRNNPQAVIALLTSNPVIQCAPPEVARVKYGYPAKADLVFAVNKTDLPAPLILQSVVRAAEDLVNIRSASPAQRFIFLIVDDEPRWFSQFLPVLYNIIGQRADVMLARTYEETLRFLFGVDDEAEIDPVAYRRRGHGDDVVSLITDLYFPKGNEVKGGAGADLIRLVNRFYARIPVVVASKAPEAREFKDRAYILPKGDPGTLKALGDYILDFTGLGNFVVLDPDGRELYRIKDIHGLHRMLLDAEKDTPEAARLRQALEVYGENDKFSTWLYMHSYRELGDRLRPRKSRGRRLVRLLKDHLVEEIAGLKSTALAIEGGKIFRLQDLLAVLTSLPPEKIQPYSDLDIFSSWLDRKGFPELADELRPIHGSGPALAETLARVVEKWIKRYRARGGARS